MFLRSENLPSGRQRTSATDDVRSVGWISLGSQGLTPFPTRMRDVDDDVSRLRVDVPALIKDFF